MIDLPYTCRSQLTRMMIEYFRDDDVATATTCKAKHKGE
jgi:hypothetical protein